MDANNTNKTHEGLAQRMSNIYDEVSTSVASSIYLDFVVHFRMGLFFLL